MLVITALRIIPILIGVLGTTGVISFLRKCAALVRVVIGLIVKEKRTMMKE